MLTAKQGFQRQFKYTELLATMLTAKQGFQRQFKYTDLLATMLTAKQGFPRQFKYTELMRTAVLRQLQTPRCPSVVQRSRCNRRMKHTRGVQVSWNSKHLQTVKLKRLRFLSKQSPIPDRPQMGWKHVHYEQTELCMFLHHIYIYNYGLCPSSLIMGVHLGSPV